MNDYLEKYAVWDTEPKWERLVLCGGTLFSEGLIDEKQFVEICHRIHAKIFSDDCSGNKNDTHQDHKTKCANTMERLGSEKGN